jgi:hypothetical protein
MSAGDKERLYQWLRSAAEGALLTGWLLHCRGKGHRRGIGTVRRRQDKKGRDVHVSLGIGRDLPGTWVPPLFLFSWSFVSAHGSWQVSLTLKRGEREEASLGQIDSAKSISRGSTCLHAGLNRS